MTELTVDADAPWATRPIEAVPDPSAAASGAVRARWDATASGIGRLAFLGGLYSVLTLGIYRFWYATDLRRQLWRRSALDGTAFEYAGTVREIFVGFLVMLAILAPIYALAYVAQLVPGPVGGAAELGFLGALFFFVGFAGFRARRYRLTRTIWRGVRFGQTGSAAVYSLRNIAWTLAAVVTLGLAVPFARASQERYRVRHTWFGDRAFASTASGAALFLPWLALLLVVSAPLAVTLWRFFAVMPLDLLAALAEEAEDFAELLAYLELLGREVGAAAAWLVIGGLLLWPAYRARELRCFVGRAALGPTRFRSDFSAVSIYRAWLGFGLLAAVALVVVFVLAMVAFWWSGTVDGVPAPEPRPAQIAVIIGGYLVGFWILGALKLRFVTAPLWGRLVASVVVDGVAHLDEVGARRDLAGAVGDDYAGGYDIGAV